MVAVLLPNAKQQFIDINGKPLVGGRVYFYVVGTLAPKNTWQNSAQTVLNTNPVILDSRGQAIIYGTGAYRQIVKDSGGNTIWDQITFAAGSSGSQSGAPKTIFFADSPYTMTIYDGVLLCDLTGGSIVVNLLPATDYGGILTVAIKGDTHSNDLTVVPNGTDTIIGLSSFQLLYQDQSQDFASDLVSYWQTV